MCRDEAIDTFVYSQGLRLQHSLQTLSDDVKDKDFCDKPRVRNPYQHGGCAKHVTFVLKLK